MHEFFLHTDPEGDVVNLRVLTDNIAELQPSSRYIVTIKKANTRSHNQNAYYWGVVCQLVYEGLKDAGFENVKNKDDAHEILKNLFLKTKEERNGITIETVKSTRQLTRAEFIDYLTHIEVFAADYLNVHIPAPNTQLTVC
jgi:hypothetical protein